jgi:phosphonate ABC transporter permease subunit PhnE
MQEESPKYSSRRLVRTLLIVVAVLLVYAFAVQATDINMEKPLDPARQENVIRALRSLADPDIVSVDQDTGRWGLSDAAQVTIRRIIETIFMALLASTAGTILAVPVSFLAARNLMEPVTAPLAAIMAAIVALPIGGWITLQITSFISGLAAAASEYSLALAVGLLLGMAVVFGLLWRIGASTAVEEGATNKEKITLVVRLIIMLFLSLFCIALVGMLGLAGGAWLEERLNLFWFVGNFIYVASDFIRVFLPPILALLGGLIAASYGSRYGQEAVLSLETGPARILTAITTALGSGIIIFAAIAFLNWLYEFNNPFSGISFLNWLNYFDNPNIWIVIPAAFGGVVLGLASLLLKPKQPFAIGMLIYTISRTILNVLRAIEPLIMAIVFVVWVSLGPFAGIMALTLHSIAALGKLFSEQIEGIDEGPVEAITATGANRLQMITYAVVPQVIPPFTAFALYRWDINVRMSTIIGFVGGGGIGFVLSQNIRQLRYRQASVMMLAIAFVVILLDYASSSIRRRII